MVGRGIPAELQLYYVVDIFCPSTRRQARLRSDTIPAGTVYSFDPVADGGFQPATTPEQAIADVNAWWGTQRSIPTLQFIDQRCQQNPAGFQPPQPGQPGQQPQEQPPNFTPLPQPGSETSWIIMADCDTSTVIAVEASDVGTAAQLNQSGWKTIETAVFDTFDLVQAYINDNKPHLLEQVCQQKPQQQIQATPWNLPNDCKKWGKLTAGSPEWCEVLDDISQFFSDLGKTIFQAMSWFDLSSCNDPDNADTKAKHQAEDAIVSQVLSGEYLPPAVQGGGGAVVNLINGYTQNLQSLFQSGLRSSGAYKIVFQIWQSIYSQLLGGLGFDPNTTKEVLNNFDIAFPLKYMRQMICFAYKEFIQCQTCNPALVGGLVLAKGVLGMLKHLRGDLVAGWTNPFHAGLKLAFHLPIDLRPVEKVIDYLLDWACPAKLPNEGEILELMLRQEIKLDHGSTLLKMHGLSPYFYDKVLHAKREKIGHNEIIEFYKRHPELPNNTDNKLAQMGFIDDEEREMIKDLFTEIPNIELHLMWLRRGVDDYIWQAITGDWQGFDDRNEVIKIWTEKLNDPTTPADKKQAIQQAIEIVKTQPLNSALQGRNFWNEFGHDLTARRWSKANSLRAYQGHWEPLAVEHAREFLYRLRKGRVPDDMVFSDDMIRRVFLERGTSPRFIDRFLATNYRTFNQRYVQLLAKLGLFDEAEISERLQDIGFSPSDSKVLAHGLELQRRLQVATEFHGWTPSAILHKYKQHLITKDQATKHLKELGATDADIAISFEVADLEKKTELTKEQISAIKKCFMKGVINLDSARSTLFAHGLDSEQIDELIDLWNTERHCDVHSLSASEDVRLTKDGVLTIDQLVFRLTNLNYTSDAIAGVVASVLLDMQRKQQAELQRQQKEQLAEQQRQAKDIAQQLKEQQREQQALQKEIARQLELAKKKQLASDLIRLNLAKAIARAQQRVAKIVLREQQKAEQQAAKDAQRKAKLDAQRQYVDAQLATKTQLAQQTTDIKNKANLAKSATSDKAEKAQITAQAASDITAAKVASQETLEGAKDTFLTNVFDAAGAQPTSTPDLSGNETIKDASKDASQEINLAQQEADIKEQGL